jgi:sec-independent protein translocase protein TatB
VFGIGASELLLVFFVALLVLGPERLPAAARTLAKLFGEFRKASDDLRIGLVGITEDDYRRDHNNPRVIEAKADEPPKPDPEAPVPRSTEHKNG